MQESAEKFINDRLGTPEERKARKNKLEEANAILLKDVVNAYQPKLSNKTKKLLHRQLQLLAECSDHYCRANPQGLSDLTRAMIEVVSTLRGQTQSFYGEYHPYVVQLPAKDLFDLYANKADTLHRLVGFQ